MSRPILRQGASVSLEEHHEISKLLWDIRRLRCAIADKLGKRLLTSAYDHLLFRDDLSRFRADMDSALLNEHGTAVREELSLVYYGHPLLKELEK